MAGGRITRVRGALVSSGFWLDGGEESADLQCCPVPIPEIHPMNRSCIRTGVALFLALNVAAEVFKPEPGFVSLVAGKDLSGWKYKPAEHFDGKVESSDGRYTAKEGQIVVNDYNPAKGPHLRQLWTQREFPKDFILRLEFRASVNADSGIFLRGPQLQCRDYLVAGPYKTLKKYKPQDWNQIEVVVKDNVAHCTCNGEVLEAALKLPETGPIGLEADRGQMEYRRIRVKELKAK